MTENIRVTPKEFIRSSFEIAGGFELTEFKTAGFDCMSKNFSMDFKNNSRILLYRHIN